MSKQPFSMPLLWGCMSWLLVRHGFSAFELTRQDRPYIVDTGEDKKELSIDLGAKAFIDFKLTKDLVKDIKHITGGDGAHAAVITAANVRPDS
jgi:Zn-dependent alcohol dehydrogenase